MKPYKLYNKNVDYFDAHKAILFESMIEAILGKDYYNYGCDTYSCNEISAYDMINRYNHKAAERFLKIFESNIKQYEREKEFEDAQEEIIKKEFKR